MAQSNAEGFFSFRIKFVYPSFKDVQPRHKPGSCDPSATEVREPRNTANPHPNQFLENKVWPIDEALFAQSWTSVLKVIDVRKKGNVYTILSFSLIIQFSWRQRFDLQVLLQACIFINVVLAFKFILTKLHLFGKYHKELCFSSSLKQNDKPE